ncbi:MAG: PEP-CTERM sorting domain-containing protein [Phycisphaerae bacterium]|nr:PEP-CTERM sorting domain-containing protein [Phycisphaerae bacterium]
MMRSRFCFPQQAVCRRLIYGLMGLAALSVSRRGSAEPVFMGLGDIPGASFASGAAAISGDGTTVVGQGLGLSGHEAFRWTLATGMVGLSDLPGGAFESAAQDVSADGSVIVGLGRSSQGFEGFRWSVSGGMVGLGDLPGGPFSSTAMGVSASGSIVAGFSDTGPSRTQAFRWTAATGMVPLGDLPGGDDDSAAYAISGNGAVICGTAAGPTGLELFRWTAESGMVGLGDLPGGEQYAACTDLSVDGGVIVGVGYSSNFEAFRWTADTGMVGLGGLDAFVLDSWAWATSGDGSIVVGRSRLNGNSAAFIWDAQNGMRELRSVLIDDYGLNLTGWTLHEATGISSNGRAITGTGRNASGQTEAWLAVIPEPGSCLLAVIAALYVLRRRNETSLSRRSRER